MRPWLTQLQRGLAFALTLSTPTLIAVEPARADGDGHQHHGMPMGSSPLGVEGPPVEGRQLCPFSPLERKTLQCGTEVQIKPGPPLRGKQLMFVANSFTGMQPTPDQCKGG